MNENITNPEGQKESKNNIVEPMKDSTGVLANENTELDKTKGRSSKKTPKKHFRKVKKILTINNKLSKSLSVWLNIFMLLAFIIFSYYQGYQTRKALKMSRDSDSVNSLLAIKDTLARERNVRKELRAYLNVDSIHAYKSRNGEVRIQLFFTNSGKTPAYNVSYAVFFNSGSNGLEKDLSKKINNQKYYKGNYFIGSNGRFSPFFPRDYLDAIFINVDKSEETMYLWGKLLYKDVFGNSHYCLFCYGYNSSRNHFYPYEKYNESDI
jgi:hypothetical protein